MGDTVNDTLVSKGEAARHAARRLAKAPADARRSALQAIADALASRQDEVLAANKRDYEAGKAGGLGEAMLDRLLLNPQRLEAMASDVRGVAALPDPIGRTEMMRTLPNGLQLGKKTVQHGLDRKSVV